MNWEGKNDSSHPHWAWHRSSFIMNIAQAKVQFSSMGGYDHLRIANDLAHTTLNGKRKGFQRKV